MSADIGQFLLDSGQLCSEEDMYVAVTRAWYRMLTREERRRHSLRPYVFGSDFMRSILNSRVDLSLTATVCARLACSHRLDELGGEVLLLKRPARKALDPLVAWWRAFEGYDGRGLHYVELGGGTIEFSSVSYRNDRSDPDGLS